MREIKFRFWDSNNWMLGKLTLVEECGIIDMAWSWDYADQYTGLKDKEGKEIYEGDIIRFYYKGKGWGILVLVKWMDDRASFGWTYRRAFGTFEDMMDDFEIEIVGNIHEHPELLEYDEEADTVIMRER